MSEENPLDRLLRLLEEKNNLLEQVNEKSKEIIQLLADIGGTTVEAIYVDYERSKQHVI